MEWVRCSERLPDSAYETYIVYAGEVGEATFDKYGDWRWCCGETVIIPTYWMPLPKPPKY